MRKWLIIIVLILAGTAIYKYIYQEHRNIKEEQVSYTLSALILSEEFLKNPSKAELKYLNQTIELFGNITEINSKDLTLNETVFCQFNNIINLKVNQQEKTKIKGRIIGYDNLLNQVKLDQCFILD